MQTIKNTGSRVLSMHSRAYQTMAGIACIEEATKLQPSRPDAHAILADIAIMTTPPDVSRALRALRRLMQLQPEDVSVAFMHAATCIQANRIDDAINGLRHVLTLQPNHYTVSHSLTHSLTVLTHSLTDSFASIEIRLN
jgi:predicted Zn-dependent protease